MASNPELKKLILDLSKISKEVKTELRKGMRKIATPTLHKVQAEASRHSTRIGPATRLTTAFTARKVGITIETNRHAAPHARPFEHGGKPGEFRHPVFGSHKEPRESWTWVSQMAHPYMYPTAVEDIDNIADRMLDLVSDVATKNGFYYR